MFHVEHGARPGWFQHFRSRYNSPRRRPRRDQVSTTRSTWNMPPASPAGSPDWQKKTAPVSTQRSVSFSTRLGRSTARAVMTDAFIPITASGNSPATISISRNSSAPSTLRRNPTFRADRSTNTTSSPGNTTFNGMAGYPPPLPMSSNRPFPAQISRITGARLSESTRCCVSNLSLSRAETSDATLFHSRTNAVWRSSFASMPGLSSSPASRSSVFHAPRSWDFLLLFIPFLAATDRSPTPRHCEEEQRSNLLHVSHCAARDCLGR